VTRFRHRLSEAVSRLADNLRVVGLAAAPRPRESA
jgi:hypothetical protein